MAVIETNSVESKTGYKKKLDSKAEQVILNIVQVNLYTYPFKSMVRELCSNSLDSLREKRMAQSILTGAKKIEDYFVQKDGELYEDSKFDPTYYNVNFFDPLDQVVIKYFNNHTESRDLFTIRDSGVGLGKKRLEKFFTPGYSSKRLNVDVLGSYGLGSKSPLATLIESYRVISIYEGKRFEFDVYVDKVDSIVSKFNDDGTLNDYVEFDTLDNKGNKMLVYYTRTAEHNAVEIQVEVKRHNKDQITEAIKSQLMYFKENIVAYDVYGTSETEIKFKSKILFENDDIVVSDNTYFSRPHFVLKGVNYGLIDFRELDLDNRAGNLGIKVDMSNVDVSPSRESITYTPKTRETVLAKYKKVTEQVAKMLEDKLDINNFSDWIHNVNAIQFGNSDVTEDKVINTLSKLIDKMDLNFTFKAPDYKIKYSSSLKEMFTPFLKVERLWSERYYNSSQGMYALKLKREAIDSASNIPKQHVYFHFTETDTKRNQYMIKDMNSVITIIKPSFLNDIIDEEVSNWVNGTKGHKMKNELIDFIREQIDKAYPEDKQAEARKSLLSNSIRALNVLDSLKQDKKIGNVLKVQVPEAFVYKEDDYSDADLEEIKNEDRERYKKILQKRKLEEIFVVKTPVDKGNWSSNYALSTFEVKKQNFNTSEIYYGTSDDTDSIVDLAEVLDTINKKRTGFNRSDNSFDTTHGSSVVTFNSDVALLVVALNNVKYVQDERHIREFGMLYSPDNKLTSYKYIKDALMSDYVYNLFKAKGINLDSLSISMIGELYPDIVPIVELAKKPKLTKKMVDKVNNQGLTNIYKAFQAQIKLILNPNFDEVDIDNIMVDALGIDVVDDIDGIDLVDTDVLQNVRYAIDYLTVFGKYLSYTVQNDPNVKRLFMFYYDKNKSLLTLEHKNLA
jgi:hypothetical protein